MLLKLNHTKVKVCNASKIGNLICDDDINIPECYYDLGDCCYTNSKKSSCSACICHLWITSTFAPCTYVYVDV